jgi:acyl-CoA synthetase (AMP-forming)/AMP-acid ligase II
MSARSRSGGTSLMSGYVGADAPDAFLDGWLRTGDLGYLFEGELYVTGRSKDMIVAMGHNYYPEDFEWAAARVDGVRPGRCVAFCLPDSEKVIVLVEANDGSAPDRLRRKIERGGCGRSRARRSDRPPSRGAGEDNQRQATPCSDARRLCMRALPALG